MDKSSITKICVDDFAIRKRYTYGTVMVDLETHRVVDMIDSRETEKVAEWLKTYPNIQVISRDGASTYANASSLSHPEAYQISDRFHLFKNLSEAFSRFLMRQFPARIEIPSNKKATAIEMAALYDTRNLSQRIRFAKQKRKEGYTISEIALCMHLGETTIRKYIKWKDDEIPADKESARERQYRNSVKQKQKEIEEVRKLYQNGFSIQEISRMTGHVSTTVKKYLNPICTGENGHYDSRRPGKLAPFEKEVIAMRSQGITYAKIHKTICNKGYTGTVASLRVFMQKEREHQKRKVDNVVGGIEYVPRKLLCKLLYRKEVKGLSEYQYNALIEKYDILGKVYRVIEQFYKIVYAKKYEELEAWMEEARLLEIPEVDSYLNGMEKDLIAVKNAIKYNYNNGLAEGSVNKIKLIKRIMYGRNSFEMLKAKILLNEYYFQIN